MKKRRDALETRPFTAWGASPWAARRQAVMRGESALQSRVCAGIRVLRTGEVRCELEDREIPGDDVRNLGVADFDGDLELALVRRGEELEEEGPGLAGQREARPQDRAVDLGDGAAGDGQLLERLKELLELDVEGILNLAARVPELVGRGVGLEALELRAHVRREEVGAGGGPLGQEG